MRSNSKCSIKQRQLYELNQQIGTGDAQTARIHYKVEVDTLEILMRSRTETQKKISDLTLKIELAKLSAKEPEKNNLPNANTKALELERNLLIAQLKQTISQIDTQAENIQKLEKFNGDADQLRAEIDQEQGVIRAMSDELTRKNVELGAPSRVVIITRLDKSLAARSRSRNPLSALRPRLSCGASAFRARPSYAAGPSG